MSVILNDRAERWARWLLRRLPFTSVEESEPVFRFALLRAMQEGAALATLEATLETQRLAEELHDLVDTTQIAQGDFDPPSAPYPIPALPGPPRKPTTEGDGRHVAE